MSERRAEEVAVAHEMHMKQDFYVLKQQLGISL
jgi:hypothetical protein